MTKYPTRVIGSTDVYSRKHIDRQIDRLERLYHAHKDRLRDLEHELAELRSIQQRVVIAVQSAHDRINLIASIRASSEEE